MKKESKKQNQNNFTVQLRELNAALQRDIVTQRSKVRKLQTELRAVKKENESLKSECGHLQNQLEDRDAEAVNKSRRNAPAEPDATPENVPFAGGEGDDDETDTKTDKEIEDEYDAKGTLE